MQRRNNLDIHELLKRDMFDSSIHCNSHFEKNKPCPHELRGVSDQYLILDSFSKVQNSAIDRGEFRWNFMVQGVSSSDFIGVNNVIETLVEIKIGKFNIPILEEVPYVLSSSPSQRPDKLVLVQNNSSNPGITSTLVPRASNAGQYTLDNLIGGSHVLTPWIFNPYSQLPYSGIFTIQVVEAGIQSYSNRNGTRHHFVFETALSKNPNTLTVEPLGDSVWDKFTFTEPLKDMHGITLIFRNPDNPIRFLPDCYFNVKFIIDSNKFLVLYIENNLLNQGDRIFITNFTSGDPSLDSYVNRADGHLAAGNVNNTPLSPGVPINNANIYTDPAINLAEMPDVLIKIQFFANVFIAKRRIRIPVRFRSIVPRLTNFMNIPG